MSDKKSSCLVVCAVCLLVLITGCAQTANLSLKFVERDTTDYKLVNEWERSVEFEGAVSDKAEFKSGASGDRVEVDFTQEIQSVDGEGNATIKITFNNFKYVSRAKNKVALDFDTSRERDRNSILGKLVGQFYTIQVSPTGKVINVVNAGYKDISPMTNALYNNTAGKLWDVDAISERHGIVFLPELEENPFSVGDAWDKTRVFFLGSMGTKTYERIYTLESIEKRGDRRIAVARMEAIPSSEMAEELHDKQPRSDITDMFDSTDTYEGHLEFDVVSGKVEVYSEKMVSEWVIVDPAAKQSAQEPPSVKMRVLRAFSLERTD